MKKNQISILKTLAICALGILTLTSCGDIGQDLKINPDGSGTLETSFNIGEMMGMMKGLGDMGEIGVSDEFLSEDPVPEQIPDTTMAMPEQPKDPMELLMEKVTDPAYDKDFDTLISFLTIMPDSVKEKETRLDLINKLSIRMRSPAKSSDLTMGILMNFDNPAQLQELITYIENMDNTNNVVGAASPGGLQSEAFLKFDVDMKAGFIRVDSVDYSSMGAEFGMPADSLLGGEDMGMIEMMFGSSKIKSVIHVPGEVISCTHSDAILTKDNKVIIEHGLMDVIKKGKMDGYTIYFTPKK